MRSVLLTLLDMLIAALVALALNFLLGQPLAPTREQITSYLVVLLLVRSNDKKGGAA